MISQATPGSDSAVAGVDVDASDDAGRHPRLHRVRMLLEAGDSPVPLINTTLAHAEAAVEMTLQE